MREGGWVLRCFAVKCAGKFGFFRYYVLIYTQKAAKMPLKLRKNERRGLGFVLFMR